MKNGKETARTDGRTAGKTANTDRARPTTREGRAERARRRMLALYERNGFKVIQGNIGKHKLFVTVYKTGLHKPISGELKWSENLRAFTTWINNRLGPLV